MFKPLMENYEVQSKTFAQKVMNNLDMHLRISTAHIFIYLLCYKMARICWNIIVARARKMKREICLSRKR